MTVNFTVFGEPVGKQRPRRVKNKYTGKMVVYTPKKTKDYEQHIIKCWKEQDGKKFSEESVLRMYVCIYLGIPKSLSKKKIEELDGQWCVKRKDMDNIAKSIMDGCNEVVYRDDSHIVMLIIKKKWSANPKAEVVICDDKKEWEKIAPALIFDTE